MVTWAKLLLEVAKIVFSTSGELKRIKDDRREKAAHYLDTISDALFEAAQNFRNEVRPWDRYRQAAFHLKSLRETTEGILEKSVQNELFSALERAVRQDSLLLDGSIERTMVDAITVKPDYSPDLWMGAQLKDNPVEKLDQGQLEQILDDEVSQILEAAGLFRAVAIEMRAK